MERKKAQRGSALLLCTIVTVVVVALSGAYVTISHASARSTFNTMTALQALYTAEAGAATCVREIQQGGAGVTSGSFGSGTFEIRFSYRDLEGDLLEDPAEAGFILMDVTGTYQTVSRRLQVILGRDLGGPWHFAIYAGNDSEDPSYNLPFGGTRYYDRVR